MGFEKGHPGGPGRPKGSKNKINQEIAEQFANVLHNKLPDMERWIQQTAQENPAKAADLLMRLSERFLPALQRTEITAKDGQDLFANIKFKFGDDINIDTGKDNGDGDFDLDNL